MKRLIFMLWAVVLKELRQTLRDRRMMFLLMAAPAVQLFLFGNAVELDIDKVPTAVVDLDQSAESRLHLRRVLADGTLRKVAELVDPEHALGLLESNQAAAVIVVPPNFERNVKREQLASMQVVLDGSDPNRANVAAGAVGAYLANESEALLLARRDGLAARSGLALPPVSRVTARSRVLFNPALKTAVYMVPGVAAMLLLLVTTVIAAMGLARERERGTLEQIAVTPLPSGLLILGKIIPFAVIGLFDFVLALVVGAYVFDMPLRGSLLLLLFATSLYLVNTLGAGLLIASYSGSQQQAFMGGFLFMLPAALLSGIMTPVRSMPEWLSPLTSVNPLRHYAEILRAVLLRGATVADLTFPLLSLAVLGLTIAGWAALRFGQQRG